MKATKDMNVTVDVVGDAVKAFRAGAPITLHQAAMNRIKRNVASLREKRKLARTHRNPKAREIYTNICARLLTDNKRVRRLIKRYPSWQA